MASELGLVFESVAAAPDVAAHASPIPRIAVWHLWSDTEATGWLRLALDQEKIPYDYIRDEEIRAGKLRDKYDIILFGDNDESWKSMVQGIDPKWSPMPYTKTPEYPSQGVPDASDDITGGIGWGGMANLQEYLNAGGLMITLGNGSALPLEGGLVRGVQRGGGGVYTPGVELKVKFSRPDHPLAYGYPTETSAFRTDLSVYSVRPARPALRRPAVGHCGRRRRSATLPRARTRAPTRTRTRTRTRPASRRTPRWSSRAAARSSRSWRAGRRSWTCPSGKGRVIAFNFSPMHRDLNHSDYRFLWNGILNWSALPPAQP